MIPQLVAQTASSDELYLVNALYFKGAWLNQFDPNENWDSISFKGVGDKRIPMIMMDSMAQELQYAGSGQGPFQMISLPYQGGRFAMDIVVPTAEQGALEAASTLTRAAYEELVSGLATRKARLKLPKFKLSAGGDLKPELIKLGMVDAFSSSKANLAGFGPKSKGLAFSQVIQKVAVSVDEAGAQAAAVTAVIASRGSGPSHPVVSADRPFVFTIRDLRSGVILFMGLIVDPSAS